jgi:hypothetical protein
MSKLVSNLRNERALKGPQGNVAYTGIEGAGFSLLIAGCTETGLHTVFHIGVRTRHFHPGQIRSERGIKQTLAQFISERVIRHFYARKIKNQTIPIRINSLQNSFGMQTSDQMLTKHVHMDSHCVANLLVILLKSAAFSTLISNPTMVPSQLGSNWVAVSIFRPRCTLRASPVRILRVPPFFLM